MTWIIWFRLESKQIVYCLFKEHIVQGTLFGALWWTKWDRNPKKKECVCVCVCVCVFTLLYSQNWHSSVKQLLLFSQSVSWSCPTLYNPMDCTMPGFPVLHHLPELSQTHVHWVSDAIHPSCPLPSPSPPAFNLSQHQGLFQWVHSSHQVA